MTEKNKVTKQSILGEVVLEYPEAGKIMLEYGLHCVGCFVNAFETIEQGAKVHSLSDQEVDELVEKINKAIAQAKSKEQKRKQK